MEKFSKLFVVKESDTAKHMGSGDLNVLATPAMIAMVENTAKDLLNTKLTHEKTSVGSFIEAKHIKPSKVGAEIKVNVMMEYNELSKVNFSFEVLDSGTMIAKGNHQRVVILTDAFLKNLDI